MTYAALAKLKKNSVSTTLSAGINDSVTTIPVTQLSVFYDADGVLITKGIVIGYEDAVEASTEEIIITGASGTSGAGNLTTATRGVKADGTIGAGIAWGSGTKIAVMFSAGIYDQICDNIAAHESGKIAKTTNITALNETGIADGEIAVFNLSNKDIRTSDKTIVTTIGADDTTVPTSKAVKDVLIDAFGVPGTSNTDRDANTTNHGLLLKAVAPGSGIVSVPGIGNGETVYALKALVGSTTPAALGTAAAGTGLVPARDDHVHSADLADGKSIKVYKALGTDLTASGITATMTAHENLAFGDVCFINASGECAKTDADAAATMPVVTMAIATISADAAGVFLLVGIARNDAWNWTPGAALYADTTTAGGLTATAPSGTTDCVQLVGRALTADIVLFKPDNSWLELT